MALRSAKPKFRRITSSRRPKSPGSGARARAGGRPAARTRQAPRTRVRVVRSRSTGARRPLRSLPPADPLNERAFTSSLERSLRDFRTVWEALAKR